ncbi:CvpA family protein [Leucothrix pacifica]|uniref:Colicin V production protein n=1 Tax=Leucothrix pacifica TaxID=1247513 RepID=A0A317C2S9_9GAMM|nr:CvpA family protein [Leucothrix pacifica]PWQ92868.1 colicin V production protein [Leucothrix pacifica]
MDVSARYTNNDYLGEYKMELNFIDIGIVVFIVITALVGLARGFVWMGLFLITWIAAAVLAFLYHDELMVALPFKLSSNVFQMIVAALIIFLGILFVGTLINYLFTKAIRAIGLGSVDRLLGAILGLALSGFIIAMATMFISLTKYTEEPMWQTSILVPKFADAANWIQANAPEQMTALLKEAGINNTPEQPTLSN